MTTRTTRSESPTTRSTASPAECGRATRSARGAWRGGSARARWRSTARRSTLWRRSAATSSPDTAASSASSGSRSSWRPKRYSSSDRRPDRAPLVTLRAMPTSLVTGGAGFLGSNLCDHLIARGHRVICVDNFETGSLKNIAHLRMDEFRFVHADITNPYEIDENVDFVYHLASPASPIDYARLPLHTLKVGSYGTHHTLGLAKWKRARFLLASTSEVYGDPL